MKTPLLLLAAAFLFGTALLRAVRRHSDNKQHRRPASGSVHPPQDTPKTPRQTSPGWQTTDAVFLNAANALFSSKPQSEAQRKAALAAYHDQLLQREAEKKARQEAVLAKWGLLEQDINAVRREANARNLHDGRYTVNSAAPYGSVDNPEVVGFPDCSNDLRFSMEREHWVLTDGLGNGWCR